MRLEVAIEKAFPHFALRFRLDCDAGIVVLFGPSGAGKSLTLYCLAGIVRPDGGHIAIDGRVIYDGSSSRHIPAQTRRVGYVPQDYGLFPHLSVAENIAFGLRRRPPHEAKVEIAGLVEMLRLTGLERRRPRELSGGEQQRVALARALATQPRVLLLDEPFSALDASMREALRLDLLAIREELGVGIVLVTHAVTDTHVLADLVALMDSGHVLQVGSPREVFRHPTSVAAARLIGARNILPARIAVAAPHGRIVALGGTSLRSQCQEGEVGDAVLLVIRPELARMVAPGEPLETDEQTIPVVLRSATTQGHLYSVELAIGSPCCGPISGAAEGAAHTVAAEGGPTLHVLVPVWWWEKHAAPSGTPYRLAIYPDAVHVLLA